MAPRKWRASSCAPIRGCARRCSSWAARGPGNRLRDVRICLTRDGRAGPAEATRTHASSAVPTRCMSRPCARHGARALRKKENPLQPKRDRGLPRPRVLEAPAPLLTASTTPGDICGHQRRRHAHRNVAALPGSRPLRRLALVIHAVGVGNMRDAAARRERSDTRSAAIVAPARAATGPRAAPLCGRRSDSSAVPSSGMQSASGTSSAISSSTRTATAAAALSRRRRSTRSKPAACRPSIASTRQAAPVSSSIARPTGRSCAPARATAWRCGSMPATIARILRARERLIHR